MTLFETIEAKKHAITVAELANLLHLGRTAIYDMTRRRAIPHYRLAGSLRFDPKELAVWLRKQAISN